MIIDRRDFDFHFAWLDLDGILRFERFAGHDRDTVDAIIDLAERVGEAELAPHLRAADDNEPQLTADGKVTLWPAVAEGVRAMASAGIFSMVFDNDEGGLQLPNLVYVATLGTLMGANLGTASFALLTVANARLIAAFGSPAQIQTFARPQIAGEVMGTMCLSEPHAGSSLGDIRTRARPDGEDELGKRFRITGNKMWISGGDQDATGNIMHLVLAKVPDEHGRLVEGSQGISLFIVPKILPNGQRNDVAVAGLNHKMGYRGIPNCALNFGEGQFTPDGESGAVGWLVGEPGQGLAQMFQMMNDARVAVGLAGAMLAERGYRMARQYALERTQGRRPATKGGPQVPIIEHPDVRRMLLAQRAIAQGALALVLYSARLLDEEKHAPDEEIRAEAASLLALLTPATKTFPAEMAQQSLHHALQIHGGAGYTRDFEIELLYRDNRLNPIHEGTTGIQGIDLVGRKIRRDKGAAFAILAARIRSTIARIAPGSILAEAGAAVERELTTFERLVAAIVAEPDEARALTHATPVLFAFGHLLVGWLWLEQALAAGEMLATGGADFDADFLNGRIRACRYFIEAELPQAGVWLAPVLGGSDIVASSPIEEF